MLGLLGETAGWAERNPSPIYVVDRMRDLVSPDRTVGTKSAGLMCLPNGAIRWKDVALGANVDQRELVQDVLEDEGLQVASLAAAVPARRQFRIRGIIRDAAFKLCASKWGFGDRSALSGDVRLEVEWRAEDAGGTAEGFHYVSTIVRHIERRDAASLGTLVRGLLEDAARDLAHWLADRRSADESPPQKDGAPAGANAIGQPRP